MPKILIAITGPSTCGKNVLSETFLSDGIQKDAILAIPLTTSRAKRDDDDIRFTRNVTEAEFATSHFFIKQGPYGILYKDMLNFSSSDAEIGVVIVGAVEVRKLANAVAVFGTRENVDIALEKVLMLFSRDVETNYKMLDERLNMFFSGEEVNSRINTNKLLLKDYFLQFPFQEAINTIFYSEDNKSPSDAVQKIIQDLSLSHLIQSREKISITANEAISKRETTMKTVYYPSYGGNFRAFITSGSDILFDNATFSELEQDYISSHPNASTSIIESISDLPDSFIISPYAFDKQTCLFINQCLENGKNVYLDKKKLQSADLPILEKAHDNIGRKDFFYDLASSILPDAMPDQNKTIFHNFEAMKQGIEATIAECGYPIIIKSSNGKGGKGCLVCREKDELDMALRIIAHDSFSEKSEYGEDSRSLPFIVEKFLDNASSYNISFVINDSGVDATKPLLLSKQIIVNDTLYNGNESHDLDEIAVETIKSYAFKLGEKFSERGIRGAIGIDFIKDQEGNIRLIEANPRINGNTHAVEFLGKMGRKAFVIPILEWTDAGDFYPDSVDQILGEKKGNAFPYNLNRNDSLLYVFHGDTKEEAQEVMALLVNSGQFRVKNQPSTEYQLEDGTVKPLTGNYAYFYQHMAKSLEPVQEQHDAAGNNVTYVIVSTEDDKYRVAGGIGTYTGILTKELAKRNISTTWITQSPDNRDFIEMTDGVKRVYLSRYDDTGNYMGLGTFSEKIGRSVKGCVDRALTDPDTQVYVESPEWEGLLSSYFLATRNPRIVKISRTHTPLIHTRLYNDISDTDEVRSQLEREEKQLVRSDVISSPTDYMLASINHYFPRVQHAATCGLQQQLVIPNCINIDDFATYQYPTRNESIDTIRQLTGAHISTDNFNLFVLGSVEKRKGVDDVLDAFNLLGMERDDAHLYLVGHYNKDGDSLTENPKYTEKNVFDKVSPTLRDRVHVLGYVDHSKLREVIKAGDVYVFAYMADNFPGSLVEVGLSSTPIVAVSRGGIPEMVKNSEGKATCHLIEESSELPRILSQAITVAGEDKLLPDALRSSLIERYNLSQTVDQMLAQYSPRKELAHAR